MNRVNKVCVIIDPAHGVNTSGKGSPYTLNNVPPHLEFREYLWSREICLMLAAELEKKGLEVFFTVTGDEEPGLLFRYMAANSHINQHPEMHHIFISIHNNAAGNGSKWCNARGWSAYTTPGQNNSDKLAECLYDEIENAENKSFANATGQAHIGLACFTRSINHAAHYGHNNRLGDAL